jgi:hypothetical protein
MALDDRTFTRMAATIVASARQNCVTPRCINRDFAASLSQKGKSVDVQIAGQVPTRDVAPGPVSPGAPEPAQSFVNVPLSFWKEAPFKISDMDLGGLDTPGSFINTQLAEAGRSIANDVDGSVLDLYKKTPFYAGTAGTTPFATSTVDLQTAEGYLIQNLAEPGNRKLILDPFAHVNALGLPGFQNAQAFGGTEVIREGRISRALGYDWAFNQNMKQHTRGVLGGVPLTSAAQIVGTTSLATDGWTASIAGILKAGDIIKIAGDNNPYVVTADCTSTAGGVVNIPISNGLAGKTDGLLVAAADNAALTIINSHRVSLALHPNFAAFAARVNADVYGDVPGQQSRFPGFRMIWLDPVSGVPMLLKAVYQHFQTEFSVSCLWGVKEIFTQYGVRILG